MTLSLQVIQFMTLMGAVVRRHPPVAARPLCWVKRTWLRDQQQGRKPNRLGPMRGHEAGCPRVKLWAVLILRWIRCALRSCTFGTPPARVSSCEECVVIKSLAF